MESSKKEFLMTHVIKNISTLTTEYRYEPEMKYANVPWRIGYRKEGESFGLFLFCGEPKSEKIWSIATTVTRNIMTTAGKKSSRTWNHTYTNNSEFAAYGSHFNWNLLLKDYVVDDTLVVELNVVIDSISGVEKPEKKRSFEKTDDEPSDVMLKVDGEEFHVSRGSLVAQSSYFKTLLVGKFKEGNQAEVELKDVDPEVFHTFLELVYMEDALTDSNIEDVLKLVDMYDAKKIARLCEQFLVFDSKLSVRTKLHIAAQYKFERLKSYCIDNLKSCAEVRAVMG